LVFSPKGKTLHRLFENTVPEELFKHKIEYREDGTNLLRAEWFGKYHQGYLQQSLIQQVGQVQPVE
jgi:hypothetical protein